MFSLEWAVRADCRDERSEDDDEGGDEEVEADAFRAVRFHTPMVHPPPPPVNPHPEQMWYFSYRGFDGEMALAPWIPRR
jgi:hypothetical protein